MNPRFNKPVANHTHSQSQLNGQAKAHISPSHFHKPSAMNKSAMNDSFINEANLITQIVNVNHKKRWKNSDLMGSAESKFITEMGEQSITFEKSDGKADSDQSWSHIPDIKPKNLKNAFKGAHWNFGHRRQKSGMM